MNATDHILPQASFPLSEITPLQKGNITLSPLPHCSKLILRGDFPAAAFPTARQFKNGPVEATWLYWLGPDEILVTTSADQLQEISQYYADYIQVDVSDYYQQLLLSDTADQNSPELRLILSQLVHLDLDKYVPGDCQQTQCGQAGILLAKQKDGYLIQYRASYADYLWEYLQNLIICRY